MESGNKRTAAFRISIQNGGWESRNENIDKDATNIDVKDKVWLKF